MYTVLVNSIILTCYWSGIQTQNTDLKYNVSIRLCGQRCYISGFCTDLKLNSGHHQSQLTINEHMKKSNTPLIQLHQVVWMYVPELQCEGNGRLVSVTTMEPRCASGQLSTRSSPSALTPVYTRTSVLSTVYYRTTALSTVYSGKKALSTVYSRTKALSTEYSRIKTPSSVYSSTTPLSTVYTSTVALAPSHTTTLSQLQGKTEVETRNCSGKCAKNRSRSVFSSHHCRDGMAYDPKRNKCVKECKRKCITYTKFVCKTFDYGKDLDVPFFPVRCYLSKNGFYEVPQEVRQKGKHWRLGVRNCEEGGS